MADENSRAKLQNVRGNSSAIRLTHPPAPDRRAAARRSVNIVSALNGFVVDIASSSSAAGAPIIAWPRNNPATPNKWIIEQVID